MAAEDPQRQRRRPRVDPAIRPARTSTAVPLRRRVGSAARAQSSQRDCDEPAYCGRRREAAGCREGVEAVARELVGRDVVPHFPGLGALDDEVSDQAWSWRCARVSCSSRCRNAASSGSWSLRDWCLISAYDSRTASSRSLASPARSRISARCSRWAAIWRSCQATRRPPCAEGDRVLRPARDREPRQAVAARRAHEHGAGVGRGRRRGDRSRLCQRHELRPLDPQGQDAVDRPTVWDGASAVRHGGRNESRDETPHGARRRSTTRHSPPRVDDAGYDVASVTA